MNLLVLLLLLVAAAIWVTGRHLLKGRRSDPKFAAWVNENVKVLIASTVIAVALLLGLAILGIAGALYGSGQNTVQN